MGSAEQSTVLVVPVESAQKIRFFWAPLCIYQITRSDQYRRYLQELKKAQEHSSKIDLGVIQLRGQRRHIQWRFELEKLKLWDATHKLKKLTDSDQVAIPIIVNGDNILVIDKWPDFRVTTTCLPISKKAKVQQSNPAVRLRDEIQQLLTLYGISEELLREVPSKWERHGDLVIIPEHKFLSPKWAAIGDQLWEVVAKCLACKRLARYSAIANNGFRSSRVKMLLGQNGEVTHVDNGIRYTYDVTKCMFSPGNITEKLRVASLDCTNETVVDLYAGIGYFTLPYLVHARACHVHACEWNPDAVIALKHNLLLNGVAERCTIHEGDNRMLQLPPMADRVNLGLIPSSEEGWPVAVQVLKLSGGILHIHGNVATFHHRKTLHDTTEDLYDESQQSDAKKSISETKSCHLYSSQQKRQENELITGNTKGAHCCFYVDGVEINTAVLDQDVRCEVKESRSGFSESCKHFRANSGISDLSDSCLCADDDVNSQPADYRSYLPCESLQHTSKKWPQASSQSVMTQVSDEYNNLENDSVKNCHADDSRGEFDMNSKDSCQLAHHIFRDCTSDNELDKTSQKRNETNVCLACERWSLCVQQQIKSLLEAKKGGTWTVVKLHLEIVKSYAPHIVHVVLDLECRPA